ncbi:histidine kinase [soil metagenome]
MRDADSHPQRWLLWAAFWAFWTTFGFLLAAPRVLFVSGDGPPALWAEALRIAILDMYSWGLVALAAIILAERISLPQRHWVRALALHLVVGMAVLALRFWLANGLAFSLGWVPQMPPRILLVHLLPWNLLFYFSLLAVGYALDYYRRYRDRELEASNLELQASQLELGASVLQTQLAEAQLQTLKMQLHPHFLFNTLHTISELVHQDPERAERMITYLGDLLRAALNHRQQQEVTLREEIELLEPYLEIEKTRFGDRLTVEVNVDPEALDARFPHLVLQPLVENAIKHGIAPRRGPGRVEISSAREVDTLRVRVRDDGRGLQESTSARTGGGGGVGLSNTRARLERLYGSLHEFRVENRKGGGVDVEFRIPFRVEREEQSWTSGASRENGRW